MISYWIAYGTVSTDFGPSGGFGLVPSDDADQLVRPANVIRTTSVEPKMARLRLLGASRLACSLFPALSFALASASCLSALVG